MITGDSGRSGYNSSVLHPRGIGNPPSGTDRPALGAGDLRIFTLRQKKKTVRYQRDKSGLFSRAMWLLAPGTEGGDVMGNLSGDQRV